MRTDAEAKRCAASVMRRLAAFWEVEVSEREQEELMLQIRSALEIEAIERELRRRRHRLSKEQVLQLALKLLIAIDFPSRELSMWQVLSVITEMRKQWPRRAPVCRPIESFLDRCERLRKSRSDSARCWTILGIWEAMAFDLSCCLRWAGSGQPDFALTP